MDIIAFKNRFEKKKVEDFNEPTSAIPLVSVAIQTYNHGKYIRQCLESILTQKTNFDFEILLGEDASKDGTRGICIEYADKYPKKIRLFLHHRENNISIGGSPTGRFNFLYNLFSAQGKYIAICEGDDYWTDPYKLQKQVDFLEGNEDFSFCFHDAKVIGLNIEEPSYVKQNKTVFTTEDLFGRHFVPTASIVFRNNIKFPDWITKVTSGDFSLMLNLSKKGKFKYIDEVMSVYRKHEGGVTQANFFQGVNKVYNLAKLLSYFDDDTDGVYSERIKKMLALDIDYYVVRHAVKKENVKLQDIKTKVIFEEFLKRIKSKFLK